MDNAEYLKKQVRVWSEKVGRSEATRRLVIAGLSPSTAVKLVKGNYYSTPGLLVEQAIKSVLNETEP